QRTKDPAQCVETASEAADISPALAYKPTAAPTESASTSSENGARPGDLGVPNTDLLDNAAAKSKSGAVKQSQTMTSRQLPTKRQDAEVMIMCHHTEHCTHHFDTPDSPASVKRPVANATTTPTATSTSTAKRAKSASPQEQPCSVPLITEPPSLTCSPATGRKSHSQSPHHIFFPMKRYYLHKEAESMRDGGADGIQALEVLHWSCDDVCRFVAQLGLEKYTPEFTVNKVNGGKLLDLDGAKLKAIGIQNHTDRSLLKKRIKDLKGRLEKERKAIEKESRLKAKMMQRTGRR
uniref:SAM domain-containing protein n=2 Tax=Plectus sambesii TaxID=2011161 RepID=A0A914UT77_9BILA